jgi:hypothetical protein
MQEALEYISEILNEHAADDGLAKDYWKSICDECYRKSRPPHRTTRKAPICRECDGTGLRQRMGILIGYCRVCKGTGNRSAVV